MTQTDKPEAPRDENPRQDENQIFAERRAKLARLREQGAAYPNDFAREDTAARLIERYGELPAQEFEAKQVQATIAGRLMLKRVMGKASFGVLQDHSSRLQIYVSDDNTGKESHAAFKHHDIGDIVGATGFLFKTRTGELTLRAHELRLLAKSLRPLPEKFHGLTDVETRYRQRYLDLIVNPESRQVFETRSRVVSARRSNGVAPPAPLDGPTRAPGCTSRSVTTPAKGAVTRRYCSMSRTAFSAWRAASMLC